MRYGWKSSNSKDPKLAEFIKLVIDPVRNNSSCTLVMDTSDTESLCAVVFCYKDFIVHVTRYTRAYDFVFAVFKRVGLIRQIQLTDLMPLTSLQDIEKWFEYHEGAEGLEPLAMVEERMIDRDVDDETVSKIASAVEAFRDSRVSDTWSSAPIIVHRFRRRNGSNRSDDAFLVSKNGHQPFWFYPSDSSIDLA